MAIYVYIPYLDIQLLGISTGLANPRYRYIELSTAFKLLSNVLPLCLNVTLCFI
jgi:hypothetical protein